MVMVVMMVVMLVTVTVVMVRSTMPGFWSMSFKMELTTTDRSKDNLLCKTLLKVHRCSK